jgi:hypothetical protein
MYPDITWLRAISGRARRSVSLTQAGAAAPRQELRSPVLRAGRVPPAARRTPEFDAGACEHEANALADWLAQRREGSLTGAAHSDGRLPGDLRRHFERQLGYDFGNVRVHADEQAAMAAAQLGALAFTLGADVFFAAGQYRPDTRDGLRLLAHELVHVVQQGAAARLSRGVSVVKCRAPRVVQCSLTPSQIYAAACPPGTVPKSFASSTRIGTAYGKWLGTMYMLERKPKPYGLVDSRMWWHSTGWFGGTVWDLHKYDPQVALAFMKRNEDYVRRPPKRADILDAERSEVYEIKPLRSAELGASQFNGYIRRLNDNAGMTSSFFGLPQRRVWKGGTWDPSRYPMILPGIAGQKCLIHAWRDPQTQGVIIYDIVCCVREGQDEDQSQLGLAPVLVTSVVRELKRMQPQLQALVADFLPWAAPGSAYAFLVPERVFQTFVLHPWEIEQNRRMERMYGTRLGPVHQKFLAELFMLSHLLPTAPVTDALFVNSGFMSKEEIFKMWGFQAAAAATGAVLGACIVTLPLAVAAPVAEVVVAAEGTAAAAAAGTTLAAGQTLAVASQIPVAASPFLAGDIIVGAGIAAQAAGGEAVIAGAGAVAPWMIGSGMSGGAGAGIGLGGVIAVIAAALVPADAEAAQNPPSSAKVIGADALHLAPIELLVPRRGVIELGAEVNYGDEKYFIIGLARAGQGN